MTGYKRCFTCNKKLSLIEQTSGQCKCGNIYCSKHRTITNSIEESKTGNVHLCTFDHFTDHKRNIKQNNCVIDNKTIFI